jgi:hypothetical protein
MKGGFWNRKEDVMMIQSRVELGDLVDVVVFFPAGDAGTKRQVARHMSRYYGIPQSRIIIRRPEEWQIGTFVAAEHLVPLDRWRPALEEGWTPYVVVRGVDLAA